jgi:predicted peptidase
MKFSSAYKSAFVSLRLCAILLTIAVIMQSCSSAHDKNNSNANQDKGVGANKETFQIGQIIDNVVCKKDASQHYALYLPSTYTSEKKYPVVYVFDPHGVGKYPIALYKNLAEQYNYMVRVLQMDWPLQMVLSPVLFVAELLHRQQIAQLPETIIHF